MAKIELKDVCKRYASGGRLVVDHMNITIEDGEFMVFVGPSGCGNSTTLRMVAGLEEISDGEIRFGGRLVNKLEPRERNVSMVFTDFIFLFQIL